MEYNMTSIKCEKSISSVNRRGVIKYAGALLMLSPVGLAVAAGDDKEKYKVELMTAAFGTGSYVMGTAIEQILRKNEDTVELHASATPGAVYNVKRIYSASPEEQKHLVAVYLPLGNELVTTGDKFFLEKRKPLKILNNYLVGAYWLATLDSSIKSVEDLKDKRIGLGRVAQISWGLKPGILLEEGYGIDEKRISYIGAKEAITALLDGKVDAAIVGGYYDPLHKKVEWSPQTTELMSSGRDVHFLPFEKEAIEKVNDGGGVLLSIDLPAGSLGGAVDELSVYGNRLVWAVTEEFPEEIAYKIVKTTLDHADDIKDYSALGKLFNNEVMIYGWTSKDLHPGAVRAYRESGMTVE